MPKTTKKERPQDSRKNIIPKEFEHGFLSGADYAIINQVFGTWRYKKNFDDGDPRRQAAITITVEIDAVLRCDDLSEDAVCYGIMDGVTCLGRLLRNFPFVKAMARAQSILDQRLSAVSHIEAAFWTHSFLERNRQLVNQDGRPVSSGEAYCYGARLGLQYALKRVRMMEQELQEAETLAQQLAPHGVMVLGGPKLRPGDRYLETPRIFQVLGGFGDDQRTFNQSTLPVLREEYSDRPSFYDVDIMTHGWSRVDDAIEEASGVLDRETSGYVDRPLSHYSERRRRARKAVRRTRCRANALITRLRENAVLFHTCRLGGGSLARRPRVDNKIFDRSVPAADVPLTDVAELVRLQNRTSDRSETWLPARPQKRGSHHK